VEGKKESGDPGQVAGALWLLSAGNDAKTLVVLPVLSFLPVLVWSGVPRELSLSFPLVFLFE